MAMAMAVGMARARAGARARGGLLDVRMRLALGVLRRVLRRDVRTGWGDVQM